MPFEHDCSHPVDDGLIARARRPGLAEEVVPPVGLDHRAHVGGDAGRVGLVDVEPVPVRRGDDVEHVVEPADVERPSQTSPRRLDPRAAREVEELGEQEVLLEPEDVAEVDRYVLDDIAVPEVEDTALSRCTPKTPANVLCARIERVLQEGGEERGVDGRELARDLHRAQ